MLTLTPRHHRDDERAFTLIELVIGMIIASLLLMFVVGLLVRSFSSGDKAAQERKAVESIERTMTQLGDDVRELGAPDRASEKLNDDVVLQDALLRKEGVVTGPTLNLDVRDIVEASGSTFAFRADVHPDTTAGPDECVRYQVAGTPSQLVRQVWDQANVAPATGCGGRMLSSNVLIEQVR